MTQPNEVRAAIERECDALKAMLVAKNDSYGNSVLDPVRVFSKADLAEQIRVRLDDKLSRLARGSNPGEDVLLDILGYLVLLRVAEHYPRSHEPVPIDAFSPEARVALHAGLESARTCPHVYRGTFAQYANDDDATISQERARADRLETEAREWCKAESRIRERLVDTERQLREAREMLEKGGARGLTEAQLNQILEHFDEMENASQADAKDAGAAGDTKKKSGAEHFRDGICYASTFIRSSLKP